MDEFKNFDQVWARVTAQKAENSREEKSRSSAGKEENKEDTAYKSLAVRFLPKF